MPSPLKNEKLEELKGLLSENGNFVLTTFTGMPVEAMNELRAQVREKESRVKVIKNNLFKIALKESSDHAEVADSFDAELKGPVAVTFIGGEFPTVAKTLVEYAKKNDKVVIKSGFMDGQFLGASEVQTIATLPSREELLAIIGRGLNTPATKIATGVNEIMAKLARAIKAVGEKNGG